MVRILALYLKVNLTLNRINALLLT